MHKFIINSAIKSLKRRGLYRTVWLLIDLLSELAFDAYNHLDTRQKVPIKDLKIPSENATHAVDYEATYPFSYIKMLHRLHFSKDFILVDVGCGKGRVLLLSALYGFRQMIGLELSNKLSQIANLNKYLFKKGRYNDRIEIVNIDVLEYQLKNSENIFYFFNPFDSTILEKFVGKIDFSYMNTPRPIYLIFHNTPCSKSILRFFDHFYEYATLTYGSIVFTIYASYEAILALS